MLLLFTFLISNFGFGPENLPGLSRNGPLVRALTGTLGCVLGHRWINQVGVGRRKSEILRWTSVPFTDKYYRNDRTAEWHRSPPPRPLSLPATSSNFLPVSMFKSDSNQPEALPVTKSPSFSSIPFLLKFI